MYPIKVDNHPLMAHDGDKNMRHRVQKYIEWLAHTRRTWIQVDLTAYRDYLLKEAGLSEVSVKNHLATLRGRYRHVLYNNVLRQALLAATDPALSPEARQAQVEEVLQRIGEAVDPSASRVQDRQIHEEAEAQYLRLTPDEADALIAAPALEWGANHPIGLRDTALIALMLCTGIREGEVCVVQVDDLRQNHEGQLAIRIRNGKGRKQRFVPYGTWDWCLQHVDAYHRISEIENSYVFRGFKRNLMPRVTNLDETTVQRVIGRYQIIVQGQLTSVKPQDLRRTYARRCYEIGMSIATIQHHLGHASADTTRLHIGLELEPPKPRSSE